jgi:acyl-coenzyme A synthetase/AMP-(fatty) acid ligase
MSGPVPPDFAVPLIGRASSDVVFRGPGRSFTTADLLAEAHRLADALPDAARLVNLCRDRWRFAAVLAASALRGQPCLLTSDASPERLRSLAERFGPAVSVADDPALPSPLRHVCLAGAMPAHQAGDASPVMLPADRLAAIVFTSGSTGEPVGTGKSWGELAARTAAAAVRFELRPAAPAAIVGTVPARHMYGFETTILLPLHAAASSWCGPSFYPSDIRTALAAVPAPRVLVTTPLQLRALLRANTDLPPMARVISATAPLDAATALASERRWGTEVWEIFGATELGSIASRRTVAGAEWATYDGVRLAPCENGGTAVTATLAAPRALGDVVEVLDPTRFRLLGRGDDVVKLAGRRASLAGLTSILTGIDGVADGVFIAPDDLDERPTARLEAFVVAPGRSAAAILAELRGRIDAVFLPRRVVLMEALPRNETGKLPRRAVQAMRAADVEDA